MGGLEIQMLESMLLQKVSERDPAVGHTARHLMLLGRQLAQEADEDETDET